MNYTKVDYDETHSLETWTFDAVAVVLYTSEGKRATLRLHRTDDNEMLFFQEYGWANIALARKQALGIVEFGELAAGPVGRMVA